MATASVSTPLKTHHGIFSTRTAGGRMPLTPSPRTRTISLAMNTPTQSSPFTPPRQSNENNRVVSQSTYGNLSTYFARSSSRTTYRDSPKSNIAKTKHSPKHLELGVSDWTLTGTGTSVSQTPSKSESRKKGALRSRSGKITLRADAGDRFIPIRGASDGLAIASSSKADPESQRPKTSSGEGSTVLANAVSAYDLNARSTEDATIAALDGLTLEENEESSSYAKPTPDALAYDS